MRYLFILKQSPYQSNLAREALDFALASAAFDQDVSVLFMGDGIFQLLSNQQSQQGKKNIEKTLASLSMFDIDSIYYSHNCSLERAANPEQFSLNATNASAQDIQQLLQAADKVFSF